MKFSFFLKRILFILAFLIFINFISGNSSIDLIVTLLFKILAIIIILASLLNEIKYIYRYFLKFESGTIVENEHFDYCFIKLDLTDELIKGKTNNNSFSMSEKVKLDHESNIVTKKDLIEPSITIIIGISFIFFAIPKVL